MNFARLFNNILSILSQLCFTPVNYYFFLYYPSDLRTVQLMDGSWVCYEQLGGGNFNNLWLDSSPRVTVVGEMGKLPQILTKNDDTLIWRVVVTKRLNIWKREIVFFQMRDNWTIFRWKIRKSPFPDFWATVADMLGYRADCCLLWTITQV